MAERTDTLVRISRAAEERNMSPLTLRKRLREVGAPTIVLPTDQRVRYVRRDDLDRALQAHELPSSGRAGFGDAA